MNTFFVPGAPVPQGRARSFRLGDGIGHYDDPKSKAWKKVVAQVASLQKGRFHVGPVSIMLSFYLAAPKSLKDYAQHTKKPDVDNLSKAILDALNGICYDDDSQVVELAVTKEYAFNNAEGVRVNIQPMVKI